MAQPPAGDSYLEVLKIDPVKGECRILGDLGHGGWKYHGGATGRLEIAGFRDLALRKNKKQQDQRLGVC